MRDIFWCLFPELRSNEGHKCQNITRVNARIIRHERKYIILLLTRHNGSINDYKKRRPCTSSPCLTCLSHSFSFCWWRHNGLLMTSQRSDKCDAIMWIMISNSILCTAIFRAGLVRKPKAGLLVIPKACRICVRMHDTHVFKLIYTWMALYRFEALKTLQDCQFSCKLMRLIWRYGYMDVYCNMV